MKSKRNGFDQASDYWDESGRTWCRSTAVSFADRPRTLRALPRRRDRSEVFVDPGQAEPEIED